MKKIFALIAAAAFAAAARGTQQAASAAEGKAIVVYFSKTGNTQSVAETVARLAGAELFRIETAEPYPDDYHTTTEVAKKQLEDGARPALKAMPENLAGYDVIYLGHPVWWHTIPAPVMTFLDGNDLSGKTIVPFATSGGSGFGRAAAGLKASVSPRARIEEGALLNGQISAARLKSLLAGLV